MRFDTVIGLGGNCEVAYHLRRHFGTDHAQIFDWWVTPFAAAVALVESDFDALFRSEHMSVLSDAMVVQCTRSGIIHAHDFPRDGEDRLILEAVETHLPELREKYASLRRRFHASCDGRRMVLFVRSWREILHPPPGYPQRLPDEAPPPAFESLIAALESRFPQLDFRILFVNYGSHRIDHPRAVFDNVADADDVVDWSGSAGGWSELFDRHCEPVAARAAAPLPVAAEPSAPAQDLSPAELPTLAAQPPAPAAEPLPVFEEDRPVDHPLGRFARRLGLRRERRVSRAGTSGT